MEKIYRFFRRIGFAYKQESLLSDWKTYVLFDLIPPIAQTLLFALAAYYIYGPNEVKKWMIGNALLLSSFQALFGVGTQLLTEKYHGTLSLLIASRTRVQEVFLSSMLSAMLSSMVTVVLGLTLVSLIMGITWSTQLLGWFLLLLMVSIFVSMSFGYILACFILVSSEVNLILNLISKLLLIFTGANFSLDKLPITLQGFTKCLPLTRSIKIAQGIMEGQLPDYFHQLLVEEGLLGIAFLGIGTILLEIMEQKSRKSGNLELM